MRINSNFRVTCLLAVGLACGSCGSGGSSGPEQGDIIDRSGVTVGAISGFGSVILNGIRFDTTNADILVDDAPGLESDLTVGQIVTVRGTVDGGSGVAASISTDPVVRGMVSSIDSVDGNLVVLQTVVNLTSSTIFGENIGSEKLGSLNLGDLVEVYGYRDSATEIFATFIERSTDSELELSGTISNLDANNSRFSIGTQVVDYAAASIVGAVGQALANGDQVEVEGADLDSSGRLIANRVELELGQSFSGEDAGTEVELEGLITRFASSTDFDLGAVAITTDANTEFSGGDADDLAANLLVEVEGRINSNGAVLADEIEFKPDANLRIEAPVDSVVGSTVTLLGFEFVVTSTTQFLDNSAAMQRTFSIADLMVNDFVAVSAVGPVNQSRLNVLERRDSGGSSTIEGQVTSFNQPDLVVQSISVASNAATEYQIGESAVDVDEFFDELELDEAVRVEVGGNQSGVLQATKMFLDF